MGSVRDILVFFLGAAVTGALVVLLSPAAPLPYAVADLGMRNTSTVAAGSGTVDDDGLAELLRNASMEDKTIIMTFTNEALTLPGSLLDIFLESLRIGVKTQPLLKHLVVVSTDAKGLERCLHMHPLCYLLAGDGGTAAAELKFMGKDYLDLMWARNRFQLRVLELGYGFLFTDLDIVWFRNPLLRIPVAADIALACDNFFGVNPYDLEKYANGGFLYARPSAASKAFFRDWYEARTLYPGEHDQFVFGKVKHELAAKHGATVQFVDTTYFSGHCEAWKKINFHEVCNFHANCMIGLQYKLDKINAVLDEWIQFKEEQLLLGANSTALTY
ncbi:unnamed protein product [Alopecurus aequalis]